MGFHVKSLFLVLSLIASAAIAPQVLGSWKYVSYQYDGQTYIVPSPGLDLRFTFYEDGTSKLRWHYENEIGFCERLAQYEIQNGDWIYQKVIWVNPNNHVSCSKDSDMQMGKESLTHYTVAGNKLMLDLELAGNPFVYILEKVQDSAGDENNEKNINYL